MAIFLKVYKSDHFQSHICPKRSFSSIQWKPCWNFVGCESFFESRSPDIAALCEIKLDGLNESSNFLVRAYISLIWKDSVQGHIQSDFKPDNLHTHAKTITPKK